MTNWTERLFVERAGAVSLACEGCGRTMWIPPSQVGQRACCSVACRALKPPHVNVPWGKRLKEERPGTVRLECHACGEPFWVPPSKTNRKACSPTCVKAIAARVHEALHRDCETCGKHFLPSNPDGRFCSQRCNTAGRAALFQPEVMARAADGYRAARAEGRVPSLTGPTNPMWRGGTAAYIARRRASGKEAAERRAYRKANPDKVREFTHRRAGRKIGNLPYGTLPKIRRAQKDRCAICRKSLRGGFHVDHIMPLARGGKHEPANLQLLCAPCNLAKSSRDPVEHMQSLGRLL